MSTSTPDQALLPTTHAGRPPTTTTPRSPLLALPAELLSNIAFFCALSPTPGPPSGLIPLLGTHPRIAACLHSDANPSLYARILRSTWDLAAVRRRYGAEALGGMRGETSELRRRWTILQTVRSIGDDVHRWLQVHGASGEQIVEEALLEVVLLIMESDGRNLTHILGWASLPTFIFRLYEAVMLPTSLQPGFPVDSVAHACHCTLTMWLLEAGENLRQQTLSLGQGAAEETADQAQEKAFILRPLVFSPQYSLFFAPWNARSLPVGGSRGSNAVVAARGSDKTSSPDGPVTHHVHRFGRRWEMKAPKLGRAAIFGLLNALDTDPAIGGVTTSASNSSTASLEFLYTPEELAADVPGRTSDFDPVSGTALRQSIPILHLPSRNFDNDWRRMTRCKTLADEGMKVSDWKGKFEGTWVGSFAYFDFNGFTEVLAGDQEAIYSNAFGQQANQIQLSENIVYVPRANVGGTGPAFAAGYPDGSEDVSRPCPIEEEDLDDEPGSEWVKELLVTGKGRSKWGKFTYRGRVRAWDGLLSVEKQYEPNDEPITQAVSAKWLYRGYVMADSRWIGKWRDTYTAEDALGYEGPFCLRRQDEPFLLPRRRSFSRVHPPKVMAPVRPPTAVPSTQRPMNVASFEAAMTRRAAADGQQSELASPRVDDASCVRDEPAKRIRSSPSDGDARPVNGSSDTLKRPRLADDDSVAALNPSPSANLSVDRPNLRRISIASLLSDSGSDSPSDGQL